MSKHESLKPNAHVSAGGVTFGNDLDYRHRGRPLPDGEPRSRPRDRIRAEGDGRATRLRLVFKASFDKANRTSLAGRRGIGLAAALPVFRRDPRVAGASVVTDVHEASQCAVVGEVVDILQIPAFLFRQTDLLIAAAQTGRVVKIRRVSSSHPGT